MKQHSMNLAWTLDSSIGCNHNDNVFQLIITLVSVQFMRKTIFKELRQVGSMCLLMSKYD